MNRCRTCKHWSPYGDRVPTAEGGYYVAAFGECALLGPDNRVGACSMLTSNTVLFEVKLFDKEPWDREVDAVRTAATFGCVLHEEQ